jgi:hypothetical protein
VRVAKDCLAQAAWHITRGEPSDVTRAEEVFFTMKSAQSRKILSTADFWWFYLDRRESGNADFAEAVVSYRDDHLNRGTRFKNP